MSGGGSRIGNLGFDLKLDLSWKLFRIKNLTPTNSNLELDEFETRLSEPVVRCDRMASARPIDHNEC